MIGFGLNIAGALLNLFLYHKFNNEVNAICWKINVFFAFFFLVLYLLSTPVLNV